jgi:hypothetical protein
VFFIYCPQEWIFPFTSTLWKKWDSSGLMPPANELAAKPPEVQYETSFQSTRSFLARHLGKQLGNTDYHSRMIISPERKRTTDWLAGSSDCWNKPQNIRKLNACKINLIETQATFELLEKHAYFDLSLIFSLYNYCCLSNYTFPYRIIIPTIAFSK